MSIRNFKNSKQPYTTFQMGLLLFGLLSLAGLGCSLGALLVQGPTPTPTTVKTPKPTFTFTPPWTPTFTPTPTPFPTNTPIPTDTPVPTNSPTAEDAEEEAPAEDTPEPEPVSDAPAEPPPPTDTPTPEPSPTPAFEFVAGYNIHDTGSPGETRITGWIYLDKGPGFFKSLPGFQMKAVAPDGNVYLSELSGDGFSDSTVPGTGDNHRMNTKLEIRPYTPGTYKLSLVEGDVQMSPEIEFDLSANPMQYIHFDFSKKEQ
ncbi:MAG: hypothetical protein R3264_12855 [Anaerolineae bacterium]|nr:hypothetical protein [Anaerolineae bacterium]